jgi:hypothetical protein
MIKLKDLKEWVNSLPEEFLEYDVVQGEEGKIDEEFYYRIDKPITSLNVDEETKEILILIEGKDLKPEDLEK